MTFTASQLQAIDNAIATGELEVHFNDKVVKYRSIQELMIARRFVHASLIESGIESAPTGTFTTTGVRKKNV